MGGRRGLPTGDCVLLGLGREPQSCAADRSFLVAQLEAHPGCWVRLPGLGATELSCHWPTLCFDFKLVANIRKGKHSPYKTPRSPALLSAGLKQQGLAVSVGGRSFETKSSAGGSCSRGSLACHPLTPSLRSRGHGVLPACLPNLLLYKDTPRSLVLILTNCISAALFLTWWCPKVLGVSVLHEFWGKEFNLSPLVSRKRGSIGST